MPNCLACSSTNTTPVKGQIHRCNECDAIFGTCYLGESYEHVLPEWETGEVPEGAERYYDFMCLGSKGLSRRHGWYYPETKRITQTG
jgi:hypothetical protein